MTVPQPPGQPPQQVQIRYPAEKATGDYANGLVVSSTAHELTIDFLVNVNAPNTPPAVELVRRVRIPIAMSGSLMAGIGRTMDQYEAKFGQITVPSPQQPPAPPTQEG